MLKRIISLLAAAAMVCSCGYAGAEAVKKERVYTVANAQGEIITIVDNIQLSNPEQTDVIIDRTSLSDIENVGGHESFTLAGEELTWQADGSSIHYQGHGTQAPAVIPLVTYELDGQEIQDAADLCGELTIHVSYACDGSYPVLALTVFPVPEGLTVDKLENACLMDTGTGCYVLGYAVPGAEDILELPAGFTIHCTADHADPQWMLTLAANDPIELLCGRVSSDAADAEGLVSDLTSLLTALRDGTEMPALTGDLKELADGINSLLSGAGQLTEGAAQLSTGAASLADGALQLKDGSAALSEGAAALDEGAASLESGLSALTENNDALNAGAAQLFEAVLAAANTQLAGLSSAGIELPALTADTYAAVLDSATGQLSALMEQAPAAAEAQVRAAVMEQEAAIRSGVEEAVRAQVLEAVLKAAGMEMTAEEYANAAAAGMVPAEKASQITTAVEAQMSSEDGIAAVENAVSTTIEDLTTQNLVSEEVQTALQTRLAAAQSALDAVTGLKTQLDQIKAFVDGLTAYTDGVTQAQVGSTALHSGSTELAAGAASLSAGTEALYTGAGELSSGAAALSEGASALDSGLRDAVAKVTKQLLPQLENAEHYLEAFRSTEAACTEATGYDLTADGTESETVYIIRTTLQ